MKKLNLHMVNKIKLAICLLCLSTIFLASCNTNEHSEIELSKIVGDDLNFCDTNSPDSDGVSYGQSGYVLKGSKGEHRKCYVKLNSFHDGIVEEMAVSEGFSTEFDKIYFVIHEGSVSVFTVNKDLMKNVLKHDLDSTIFVKKSLNAWYWKDDVKVKNDGSATIFASFFQSESEVFSPDLDYRDVEEYAMTDKARRGIFLKFHVKNDSD